MADLYRKKPMGDLYRRSQFDGGPIQGRLLMGGVIQEEPV